jgi:hypothetical protein
LITRSALHGVVSFGYRGEPDLTVLKDNKTALSGKADNLPSGPVGTGAHQIVAVARKAIASGDANDLNVGPSGGDIDTYCGVDGNGDPLPTYFATGKGSSFCSTFIPIYDAVGNASGSCGSTGRSGCHNSGRPARWRSPGAAARLNQSQGH